MSRRKKIIIIGLVFVVSIFFYMIIAKTGGPEKPIDLLNDQNSFEGMNSTDIKEDNLLELQFSNAGVQKSATNPSPIIVDKAVVCLDIRDRMPVQETQRIGSNSGTIFCWSILLNGEGKKIRYIWNIGENVTTSQWLSISSNRFRAWCPKNIDYKMQGHARVDIVDENGRLLKTIEFEIIPARTSKSHIKYS
ncbi:MAG: DUF2914 domain-containing protein [Planctomycetota bacterium]